MSTQEIIAELPGLSRMELELVNLKLHELLSAPDTIPERGGGLKQFSGALRGLPSDLARNHDHYLHGLPKR